MAVAVALVGSRRRAAAPEADSWSLPPGALRINPLHPLRPLPQDGPRGLPHHVSREAAVFEVMLTRGYSGTRAGTFTIPIPGAIAGAMKRRPRCGPRPNGRAQRCPCPPGPGAGYELIEGHRCASTATSSSRSISLPSAPDNQAHAPAYYKFESSPLQQTVRLSRDFSFPYRKAGSCRGVRGPGQAARPAETRRARRNHANCG